MSPRGGRKEKKGNQRKEEGPRRVEREREVRRASATLSHSSSRCISLVFRPSARTLLPHELPTATHRTRERVRLGVSTESKQKKKKNSGQHSSADARTRGPSFFSSLLSFLPPLSTLRARRKNQSHQKNSPHKETERLALGSASTATL